MEKQFYKSLLLHKPKTDRFTIFRKPTKLIANWLLKYGPNSRLSAHLMPKRLKMGFLFCFFFIIFFVLFLVEQIYLLLHHLFVVCEAVSFWPRIFSQSPSCISIIVGLGKAASPEEWRLPFRLCCFPLSLHAAVNCSPSSVFCPLLPSNCIFWN